MQGAPNKCGAALAALQSMMSSTSTNPTNPANLSKFLPRAPDEGHAPRAPAIHQRQGKDGGIDTDLSFRLTFLSDKPGTRGTGPRGQPNTQDPQARR